MATGARTANPTPSNAVYPSPQVAASLLERNDGLESLCGFSGQPGTLNFSAMELHRDDLELVTQPHPPILNLRPITIQLTSTLTPNP